MNPDKIIETTDGHQIQPQDQEEYKILMGNTAIRIFMKEETVPVYCEYHKSFDWLMPVVIKIGKFSPYSITESGVRISDAGIVYKLSDSLMENVWNAVVLYIEWFNNNQHRYAKE